MNKADICWVENNCVLFWSDKWTCGCTHIHSCNCKIDKSQSPSFPRCYIRPISHARNRRLCIMFPWIPLVPWGVFDGMIPRRSSLSSSFFRAKGTLGGKGFFFVAKLRLWAAKPRSRSWRSRKKKTLPLAKISNAASPLTIAALLRKKTLCRHPG